MLFDKDLNILITGGTGSLGQALIRKFNSMNSVRRIVCFSRDELKQSIMEQEFGRASKVRFFIGDIRDEERLSFACRGVNVIINAAAMKQVVASEYNPTECIKTNIEGVENIVTIALKQGIRRVLGVSTDKAVGPCNIYGASKLVGEKLVTAANNLVGSQDIRFSSVRYGNVLGSRGSIASVYKKIVDDANAKGIIPTFPVTDGRMTRFTITMPQTIQVILDALADMKGGEIFVPKLPSYGIADFCVAFSDRYHVEDLGIREGERLFEVLISEEQGRLSIEFDNRFVISPEIDFGVAQDYTTYGEHRGLKMADGFSYRSDQNHMLSPSELRSLLNNEELA